MSEITIKQAKTDDIPIIENILLDTVNWLNEMEQPLWGAGEVSWDVLSKNYQIGDFYIAYSDGKPSGCMALVDYDLYSAFRSLLLVKMHQRISNARFTGGFCHRQFVNK